MDPVAEPVIVLCPDARRSTLAPLVARIEEAGHPVLLRDLRVVRGDSRSVGVARVGIVELLSDHLPFDDGYRRAIADSSIHWIAVTDLAARSTQVVRELLWRHCWAVLPTPLDTDRLLELLAVAGEHARLAAPDLAPARRRSPLIGQCEALDHLRERALRMAGSSAPVLITGETGTGKELLAQAIHEHSSRAGKPFVAVNCGALPAQLVVSELFGHERGAFTGAATQRLGRVELANGGTLFLDEIGDLPPETQVTLLRFLQEGTIERLGGGRAIPVDVRIVAATHVDLEAAVAEGRFRADLYHRLSVLRGQMPPLRERGSDVLLLAEHFLRKHRAEATRRIRGFSTDAIDAMLRHPWPGNVRELENRVRSALVMGNDLTLRAEDLGLAAPQGQADGTLEHARDAAETAAVRCALIRHNLNVSHAARTLGVSRMTLYRLVEKHRSQLRDVARQLRMPEDLDEHEPPPPPPAPASLPLRARGFTLLELLVVLLILGLLAGYVAPRYMEHVGRSSVQVARTQISSFSEALEHYRLSTGRYPTTEQGLDALTTAPAGEGKWAGPYLKKAVPADPWGRPYEYRSPGRSGDFEIVSLGRDGKPGGSGEDADIGSWQ